MHSGQSRNETHQPYSVTEITKIKYEVFVVIADILCLAFFFIPHTLNVCFVYDCPATERRCPPGLRLPQLRGGEGQGLPTVF